MEILVLILLGSFVLQALYYVFLGYYWYNKIAINTAHTFPKVSVVICAKNEAENLAKNLPLILQQNYTEFEVQVVDDGSTDDTSKILQQLKDQYSQLKSLYISPAEKTGSGKKYALQKGVLAAAHEVILVTDADCTPATPDWIQKMSGSLAGKEIALGISPYKKEPGFLNALVEYETALTALQYMSYCHANLPYMGVGRNMCFRKEIFLQKKWSEAEMQMPSGDDDLFIQSMSSAQNTGTCLDKDAFTYSAAPPNWKAWYRQKKRHLATGFQYALKHQVLLGSFLVSKIALYFSFLYILLHGNQVSVASGIIISYFILISLINYNLQNKHRLVPRWYMSPLLDIAYVFSIIFTGMAGKISPQQSWK